MYYGERQMIEGVPGDENTAVTMRAIKDILDEAGASHLLMSDRAAQTPSTPAPQGPLGTLAAQAAAAPRGPAMGLQMPPPVGSVRVRPHAQTSEAQRATTAEARGGILSGLFGRK